MHSGYFETISAEDSGLLTRVDRMQGEDRSIGAALNQFACNVAQRHKLVDNHEIAEMEFKQRAAKLADDGVAIVIRIRKQEAAAETWYSEALQRDRGTVD